MFKVLGLSLLLGGCATVAPYQKEFLVHPLMQDKTSSLSTVSSKFEQLNSKGSSTGTSCPTCG